MYILVILHFHATYTHKNLQTKTWDYQIRDVRVPFSYKKSSFLIVSKNKCFKFAKWTTLDPHCQQVSIIVTALFVGPIDG